MNRPKGTPALQDGEEVRYFRTRRIEIAMIRDMEIARAPILRMSVKLV